MVRVLFVNGFNRSGTTLVTAAATLAANATTLTVGQLARHLPSVERFLATARNRPTAPDRGVDRLPVQDSTPEEYGWLLHARTGDFGFGARTAQSGVLQALVAELARGEDPVVVLKNPWDTGREQLLLDHFAGSQVLLVRRRLSAIEDSVERAWSRMATSTGYVRALMSDRRRAAELVARIINPGARREMIRTDRRRTRRAVLRLARGASKLPLDRVAFLSYDELRDDPRAAAAWAGHLLDPAAFGEAVAALTFAEHHRAKGSILAWLIDRYWAYAWWRARASQRRAGILPAPDRR